MLPYESIFISIDDLLMLYSNKKKSQSLSPLKAHIHNFIISEIVSAREIAPY